jgi:glycine cleavage system aminomethyltransferase T
LFHKGDFVGKAALTAQKEKELTRKMVQSTLFFKYLLWVTDFEL